MTTYERAQAALVAAEQHLAEATQYLVEQERQLAALDRARATDVALYASQRMLLAERLGGDHAGPFPRV